jgi:hypothetical protein
MLLQRRDKTVEFVPANIQACHPDYSRRFWRQVEGSALLQSDHGGSYE